jgi:heterodisulfide reductase subunit A-like polyferredoxin
MEKMEQKNSYKKNNAVPRQGKDLFGSVMVLGSGIAGMQSALDLANSGYYVYLVERSSAIGGLMSQLDKTFPTNDCAM